MMRWLRTWSRDGTAWMWAVALAGLAYLVGLTVWLGSAGLAFPYQLDYGEGFLLHFVKQWSLGEPIYKAAEGFPYVMANYPPLAILLALGLTPVLGISYAAGRLWTLLAIFAVAAILAVWVWRQSHRRLLAVAAGLLFAGSPYVYHWAPLFRVDLIGLALTCGGLYAVFVAYPPRSPAFPAAVGRSKTFLFWLAVVLFVAGLYAKQSFFFAPAAAMAYLFLFRSRRAAVLMAAAMAALGGGIFLGVNALTGGGFWYGLVASNVNPFLWSEFWRQLADFARTYAVLILLSVWYLVDRFLVEREAPWRDKVSPIDLYLLAALLSLWFAGKAGAWENYFFEALAALALCAGLGLTRLLRYGETQPRVMPVAPLSAGPDVSAPRDGRGRLVGFLVPLLLLAQAALMWHSPRGAIEYLRLTRQSNEQIAPILAATPDPIASEDMGLLVTNGKALDYCSFQYSQLARAGRWDQAWELGQLRERRWSLVILEQGTREDVDRYQRFTREFMSELDRNYRHTGTVGKYEVYEPAPLQVRRRFDLGDRLSLVGWTVEAPDELAPGDRIDLAVVWRAQQKLATDYTAFAHLVDETGRGWAGDDHPPLGGLYPTSAWGTGEMVRDRFSLVVPAGAPPGLYYLQVGWYDPATEERLVGTQGDAVRVSVLPMAWSPIQKLEVRPLAERFGKGIVLEGYTWQAVAGGLEVTLRWSASESVDEDFTVFVHLLPSGGPGQPLAQGDAPPLGGRWPTGLWRPGLVLDDVHTMELPPDLAGRYDLLVGLYDPLTNERLKLVDGRDAVRLPAVDLP